MPLPIGCVLPLPVPFFFHFPPNSYNIIKQSSLIIIHTIFWGQKTLSFKRLCFFFLLYYFTFSRGFEEGLKALIGVGIDKKEIAFSELFAVPRFLRFGLVILNYYSIGQQSFVEKFELFRRHLPSIKATLYDSSITCFKIDNPNHSIDYSTPLEHIRNIVSICDSSRGYSFAFYLQLDSWKLNVYNLIASILEMPAIASSSTVDIESLNCFGTFTPPLSQLPTEIISNWLNRERQAMNQKQRERVFQLNFHVQSSLIQEMYDFLKQVFFLSIHILNLYTFIICGTKFILFMQHLL